VSQDLCFELAQLGGELESKLFCESSTCRLQHCERVCLTAGPIEGGCQLPHQAFTQRLLLDQLLELGY
jgi:hypothetical protein